VTTPGLPPGATLLEEFITPDREHSLIDAIDASPWRTDLRRRVQHYGWLYDYRARQVTADAYLGPLPQWLSEEAARLLEGHWFAKLPDQTIVNEYEPGQGISAHVDCTPCFGPVIASLSLGSACEMMFRHPKYSEPGALLLPPRSLLVLTGPARHTWTHAIAARMSDTINGKCVPRRRRISLTYRTVIPPGS